MIERKVIVRVTEGLHARPATEFVKLARGFASSAQIDCAGRSSDAKSAVKLMLLGVKEADEITIRATGPDEDAAVQALTAFVSGGSVAPASAAHETAPPPSAPALASPLAGASLRGAAASEGVAIGPAFAFFPEHLSPPRLTIAGPGIEAEQARLRHCLAAIEAELAQRAATAAAGSEEANIVAALAEIGRDPELIGRIEAAIASGGDAVTAALDAGQSLAQEFDALADPYMRARADDVRAVARRLALALLGKADARLSAAAPGSVIVAGEINAFDLVGAPLASFAGLVCLKGGATSHVAIIARSQGLPAVLGLPIEAARLREARMVALDGGTGEVALDPDEAATLAFGKRIEAAATEKSALLAYARVEPRTRGGRLIEVAANIGSLKDIDAALAAGAMGVGLFRTELLFMEHKRPPTEDEQTAVYTSVARAFAPHPVIVRTLDIGGDKPAPGLHFPHEDNPFLGWRGVRFCLDRPDVFKPQLRALLRAAAHGNIKVMAPMIAEVGEVVRVKQLLADCRAELTAEGVPHDPVPLGVMMETPAAALLAPELAEVAAFFSIGTNDLTQYVMAADRLNPHVAHLNRVDHPAVMRAIEMICRGAAKTGLWVGICGEAAAQPDLIPRFAAMGVNELSMSAASILRAKKCVIELD